MGHVANIAALISPARVNTPSTLVRTFRANHALEHIYSVFKPIDVVQ